MGFWKINPRTKFGVGIKLFRRIAIAILLIAVVVLGIRFLSGDEDTWLCQNGQWIKYGKPSASQPSGDCGIAPQEVLLSEPQPNQTVSSPLTVEGRARGSWFFEAVFPVELIDNQGKILGQSYAQAQSDWMTADFVPFMAAINYTAEATTTGKLVLKNDNFSDFLI